MRSNPPSGSPIRRSRRAPGRSARSCAASSARTSRSTNSNADLAHDLRVLLRQRLVAGDTDQQVLDYLVARYGVFVLLDPPFEPATYLLWLTPPLLVLGAGAILLRRRRRLDPRLADLTPAERARAAALLGDPG